MNKVEAIYARQSIDKKDSVSIEAQIEFCKKFLVSDNFKVYYDKGFSAKTIDRPKMNELNKDIEDGKISRVISYRLDRISRNIVDFGNLLTKYSKFEVEYISATENFDTSTPMGRAMVYIVMVFAQLERETIANRIADNYKFRSSTGKYFMGGNIPFGYKTEKTLVDGKRGSVLIPGEQEVLLKKIYKLFLSGYGLNQIVKELNTNGERTSNNKLWGSTAIKRVLMNITPCVADEKMYHYLLSCGYNITNDINDFDGEHGVCIFLKSRGREEVDIKDQVVAVGIHKPIIPSDDYIKAQIKLQLNKENKPGKQSKRTFLAGLMKCKECGYSFGIKTTASRRREYSYYYCRGRHSRGVCTNDLWIKAEELEAYIITRCLKYLNSVDHETIEEVEKASASTANDEILLIENQIDNLILNIGKGNNVVDELLTNKITKLQDQISEIKKQEQSRILISTSKEDIQKYINQLNNITNYSMDEKIAIMNTLINKIIISHDGEIDIKFKLFLNSEKEKIKR